MKKFIRNIFTKHSPSMYFHEKLIGKNQDNQHTEDKVYLSSHGELVLNLNHPSVQKKLGSQIETFAQIKLDQKY